MRKMWGDNAWEDYLYWQHYDRKLAKKINDLIKSIEREGPMRGEGKPERLRHKKAYSRRITDEHRLTYEVKDDVIYIFTCRGHYED